MLNSLFLQAFQGTNQTVPVWFMRQAGRYSPGYQQLKKSYALEEMFSNPEIASDVTVLPIDELGVDAAILFADILTLPQMLGFDVKFVERVGPVIADPVASIRDLDRFTKLQLPGHIPETIKLVKQKLRGRVPLIGFAGAPFTVLCYLIEGSGAGNFSKVFWFAQQEPEAFCKILNELTKRTIEYLALQKAAGIDAFQLFDTWAGSLRTADYQSWALPFATEVFKCVDLPSIYYLKNSLPLLKPMLTSGADFVSVCHTVALGEEPLLEHAQQGVQGNLFNGLLFADPTKVIRETKKILNSALKYKRYIFNLNHGVLPQTSVQILKEIVDTVHEFKR